jgi:hypothetical protein
MQQQEQPRRRPTRRQVLWTLGLAAVLAVDRYDKTLWDWMKLLIVPAVIAGGGLWFNRQQRERELEIAREPRERDVEIADRRAQERSVASVPRSDRKPAARQGWAAASV